MEQPRSSDSYEFIVTSSYAGVPTDQDIRRLIRRQGSMSRVAAARRQRGLWGQSNHRQHLVSQPDLEAQAEAENEAAAPGSARASSSL